MVAPTYYLGKFCAKNAQRMKEIGPGASLAAPFDPTMNGNVCIILDKMFMPLNVSLPLVHHETTKRKNQLSV